MTKEAKTFLGIMVLVVAVIAVLIIINKKTPGKYDDLAMCITDSGAKFYGAYWCPHCAATKQMFGKSAKKLPYVECAASQTEQTQICIDNKIEGYPTWIFADGSRLSGELTFAQLAEKTGCTAPAK
jgi:thiol-disulfide isomerase/thioredoxin